MVNGEPNINDEDFQVLVVHTHFYGGFRIFTYKNLSLDVYFHGSLWCRNLECANTDAYYGRGEQNVDPIVLQRWNAGVNETSDISEGQERLKIPFNVNIDLNIEDRFFLMIEKMSLNYEIPWKQKA